MGLLDIRPGLIMTNIRSVRQCPLSKEVEEEFRSVITLSQQVFIVKQWSQNNSLIHPGFPTALYILSGRLSNTQLPP